LKVTKIHQVVEYTPAACFQKFRDNISDARLAGDIDPNKKIVAETKKLEGNSSHGMKVTNKERILMFCIARSTRSFVIWWTLPVGDAINWTRRPLSWR
jgi:hypothetical protein